MAQEGQVTLTSLLSHYRTLITYRPLSMEVAVYRFVPADSRTYEVPSNALLDPAKEVEKALCFVGNDVAAVLLPGSRFDASGTRHGRGGGWYDRFLAQVPRNWLRIGFCFDDQFSPTPLVRQPWDEPVDHIIVVSRESGETTLYSSPRTP